MSSENLIYYSCGHHFWGGGREEPGRPDLSSDWTRDPAAVAARLSKPHPCENCGKFKSSPTGERTLPFTSDFENEGTLGGTKALGNYSNSIRVPEKSNLASSANGFETTVYIASFLRNLLARYYTLDALSILTPEVINGCLDSISGEPPSRPLVDSVASVYVNIPRSWLAISRMKRDLLTDVLHKVLGILADAQEYTQSILGHTSSIPTLRFSEQELMNPILIDCIRARKLVIDMLHHRIQAHLVGRTNEKQETVLDHPASQHSWSWESPVRLQSLISIGLLKLRMMLDPLEEGKNRIVWTCHCGQTMYDDFVEMRPGAAEEYQRMLNYGLTQKPTTPGDQNAQPNRTSNQVAVANTHKFDARSQTRHPAELKGENLNFNPSPKIQERNAAVIDCGLESRWLLVCAKGTKRPTCLSQIDLCSTETDRELFAKLKDTFFGLRTQWSRWFSLSKVRSIRFIQVSDPGLQLKPSYTKIDWQFELYQKRLVDIRKVPDMPPDTRRDEYLYHSYDLLPPVGEHLMAHFFHYPEHANENAIAWLRTPKKRRARLTVCPQQGTRLGWGIHLVEGWILFRIWLLILSLFLLGSLAFGIYWAVSEHDVQGAFGVAGYMVTFTGIVVGLVQASLD